MGGARLDIPSITAVHQAFEQEWERLHRVYGSMLSVKTLKVVKGLARNVYLQGRIDGTMAAVRSLKEPVKGERS